MAGLIATGTEPQVFESARHALAFKLEENIRLEPARHALDPLRGFVDVAVIETDRFEPETINIVAGVASYFRSRFYIVEWSKTLCVYHIITRVENVESMRLMVNYVREHARRLSHEAMWRRKFDKATRHAFRHAFRLCVAQRFRREVTSSPCLFLSQEETEISEWLYNFGYLFEVDYRPMRTRKSYGSRRLLEDTSAFAHGFLEQDKITLGHLLTVIPEAAAARGPRAR